MSGRKKVVAAVAAVLALLVLGLIAVLFTEFDSPELGRLALARIGESSGLDLRAEGFRLNLLRGLELEKVEAEGQLADGEIKASMERLVLKHRPADLLGGTLTVTEMILDRPRLELVTTAEAAPNPDSAPAPAEATPGEGSGDEAAEGEATSLDLAISTIRLEDGSFVQRSPTETTEVRGLDVELYDLRFGTETGAVGKGEIRIEEIVLSGAASDGTAEETAVRGFDLELRELVFDPEDATRLAGAILKGDLQIAEIRSGDTHAQDASGKVDLAAGQFQLQELQLTAPQGVLRGKLEADIGADPLTYTLRLDGDALNTGVLLGIGEVGGLGTSKLELSASGSGSDPEDLLGGGRLTVGSGTLPDHSALLQVEQILGNAALVGSGYEAFPLEFDIRSNRLHLAQCELSAGPVSLTLGGWVDFDGPLEMQLSVLTPREGLAIKEIPDEVLDALAEADGRVNLPMLVSGTSELASVALDRDFLKQQGKKYVQKTVEKELGKALSGLFGKKDDG